MQNAVNTHLRKLRGHVGGDAPAERDPSSNARDGPRKGSSLGDNPREALGGNAPARAVLLHASDHEHGAQDRRVGKLGGQLEAELAAEHDPDGLEPQPRVDPQALAHEIAGAGAGAVLNVLGVVRGEESGGPGLADGEGSKVGEWGAHTSEGPTPLRMRAGAFGALVD